MNENAAGSANANSKSDVAGVETGAAQVSGSKRAESGTRQAISTVLLVGGIFAMTGGWSGYAVTQSLAGTDSLRRSELDRRILAEARQLADAASNRLSLAVAWAHAEQLVSTAPSSTVPSAPNPGERSSVRPPVAQWHLESTIVREQTLSGPGLHTRLGNSDWAASLLSDGSLQLVSRLQAATGSAEAVPGSAPSVFLVSRWKEGILGEALGSMASRSEGGRIRARVWLNAEESLGPGSMAVDRGFLNAVFSGVKLRGFGALSVQGKSLEASRRMAFERASGGALVVTVDAEAPSPTVAWGWIQASASPYFVVLALAGAILAGLGAVSALLRAPSIKRAKEAPAKIDTLEPLLVEAKSPGTPALATMGLGAESAGAPVFVSRGAPPMNPVVDAGDAADSQELQELRLRVTSLEREIESARRIIRVMQDEDRVVFEFERDAVSGRDPRNLGDRLAKSASKLCGSPALYLQFQAPLEALSLVAESGIDPALVPSQLHVPIDAAATERISQLAQEGAIPSLAGYEPLAQAVLRHFGASHFDAWAVTGYSWLGRAAGKPKLIGVLVLLQPGSETLTRVRSLGRMVRNVGLLFENTLLSQH